MSSHCAVCNKAPRGFGWKKPTGPRAIQQEHPTNEDNTLCRFCSSMCQNVYFEKWRNGVVVNKTEIEQKAIVSVLEPLGDYVCSVGMDKPLSQYTKDQILGLVDTVLDSHQKALQELYKNDIPF